MNASKQFMKNFFYSTNVMIIKAKILFDFWIIIFKITGNFCHLLLTMLVHLLLQDKIFTS